MKTVLAFGTFDGLHDGHRHFLRSAREHGDRLVVAVARDETTATLKGRPPRRLLEERMRALRQEGLADEVVPGDEDLGSWGILEKVRPDVVCLGYDQLSLQESLKEEKARLGFSIELADGREPDRLHSSLLEGY